MEYLTFIPAAPKDYHKLPYVIDYLKQNLRPKPIEIVVVSQTKIPNLDTAINLLEKDVLDLDPLECKTFNRPQWIYQQFLKLFGPSHGLNYNGYYLVVDSDFILLKEQELFTENDKPIFFLGNDQNHRPYFDFMEYYLGFRRVYPHSFISEIMMMNTKVVREISSVFTHSISNKNKNGKEIESIYKDVCSRANNDFIPADYEIYGNFVEKYYNDSYLKKKIKVNLNGKHGFSYPPFPWTDAEISDETKKFNYDAITVHTWL